MLYTLSADLVVSPARQVSPAPMLAYGVSAAALRALAARVSAALGRPVPRPTFAERKAARVSARRLTRSVRRLRSLSQA